MTKKKTLLISIEYEHREGIVNTDIDWSVLLQNYLVGENNFIRGIITKVSVKKEIK